MLIMWNLVYTVSAIHRTCYQQKQNKRTSMVITVIEWYIRRCLNIEHYRSLEYALSSIIIDSIYLIRIQINQHLLEQ